MTTTQQPMLNGFKNVIVTSSNERQCELFRIELERRKGRFFGDDCTIQSISDPLGMRVGSGGSTFQAIAQGYDGSNLLILHSGGDSRRNPLCTVTGKAFAATNFDPSQPYECPLDLLLVQLSTLLPLNGVLIAATDTLVTNFRFEVTAEELARLFGDDVVTGVGVNAPWDFATRHGCFYQVNNVNGMQTFGILQKGKEDTLREVGAIDTFGDVLLDSGIVFMGSRVAHAIKELMLYPPFVGLTPRGLDSGLVLPIRFELYTDVMGALRDVWPRADFIESAVNSEEREIRVLLSQALDKYSLEILKLSKECRFVHIGSTREHREFMALETAESTMFQLTMQCRSLVEQQSNVHPESVVINSRITSDNPELLVAKGAVVEHSMLGGFFHIGEKAFVSNVRCPSGGLFVPRSAVLQELPVSPESLAKRLGVDSYSIPSNPIVWTLYGVDDKIKDTFPVGAFMNVSWSNLTALEKFIWTSKEKERTLWNAKLFPVMSANETERGHVTWLFRPSNIPPARCLELWKVSLRVSLSDLVWITSIPLLATWRYETLQNIILADRFVHAIVSRTSYPLENSKLSLPITTHLDSAAQRTKKHLLATLDRAAASFSDESLGARTLSLIGDLLATASDAAQSRSGDSSHPEFVQPINALSITQPGSTARLNAIKEIAVVRESSNFADSPSGMLRAARHYDVASQILVGRCLFVEQFDFKKLKTPVAAGVWITATAPARCDLSGGWSDTPPICNESGGAVCNVAVMLEKGVHPLGASARKIDITATRQPIFLLRSGRPNSIGEDKFTVCQDVTDFSDHANPRAKSALAKCVMLALMDLSALFRLDFGVELCIWSDLPPGSGLGGSSIIAACAVLAVGRVLGYDLDKDDVVKVVLKVEQLLSSGGGWQDQIGAIYPMFKIGTNRPVLPIHVEVQQLEVTSLFRSDFEARAMLVQTGPARLARDLLQNVIRRWHRREIVFTEAIQRLRENSYRTKEAILSGNLDAVCDELNEFWRLKKLVAGERQAEPDFVKCMFDATSNFVRGRSVCGAGGGGFALLILKPDASFDEVRGIISANFPDMIVHHVYLCDKGLTLG